MNTETIETTLETPTLNADLKQELVAAKYDDNQMREIETFLRLGKFCPAAHICLVRLLSRAKKMKEPKPFDELMGHLWDAYLEVWKNNPSDRVGDPDDVATISEDPALEPGAQKLTSGWQNACAYFQIYKDLGMGSVKTLS